LGEENMADATMPGDGGAFGVRLAIFDLDGTLLDSLADLAASANEMLAGAGFPVHPEDAYRRFVGDGARVLVERILPPEARDEAVVRECLARYGEIYGRRWDERSRPYEGIPELLDGLERHGVALAVLSNKPQAATERCVARFFPGRSWLRVLGQREGRPKKPAPDGVFEILAAAGVAAEETVYFGDTDTDMRTAAAAGVLPVGVLWGFRDREELERHGAVQILRRPEEFFGGPDPS
jgi:phosphoglycolate phosphatase